MSIRYSKPSFEQVKHKSLTLIGNELKKMTQAWSTGTNRRFFDDRWNLYGPPRAGQAVFTPSWWDEVADRLEPNRADPSGVLSPVRDWGRKLAEDLTPLWTLTEPFASLSVLCWAKELAPSTDRVEKWLLTANVMAYEAALGFMIGEGSAREVPDPIFPAVVTMIPGWDMKAMRKRVGGTYVGVINLLFDLPLSEQERKIIAARHIEDSKKA